LEVKNLKEYVARQATEHQELEEQKKKHYQYFLDAQTDVKIKENEKKSLEVTLSELENELIQKRKRLAFLESKVNELEREKEVRKCQQDLM
jgi:hypothetical protein